MQKVNARLFISSLTIIDSGIKYPLTNDTTTLTSNGVVWPIEQSGSFTVSE